MDRIPAVRRAILSEHSLLSKAAWTVAAVVAPTATRWIIDHGESGIPFVTYFPAVLLAAVFLGWESAAIAAAASAIIANRLLREDPTLFDVSGNDAVLVSLFLLACVIVIGVGQTLRRLVKDQEIARLREEELKRELLHRSKNMLVVVQSLASLTSRHSAPEHFAEKFSSRLEALDHANSLLGASSEQSSDIVSVVEQAVEPFFDGENIILRGESFGLPSSTVIPLSLALHELCTNAVKYGALSNPKGKVLIEWELSNDTRLRLRWQESGGPQVVKPTRRGMGRLLLRRQRGINDVQLHFHETGVECLILLEASQPLEMQSTESKSPGQ